MQPLPIQPVQFNPAQQEALITAVASTGASIALVTRPEYRPAFAAASSALGILSTSTNLVSVGNIQAALQELKIKGSDQPIVAVSIQNALTLMTAFGVDLQALPASQQLAGLQRVAAALKTGIDDALMTTAGAGTTAPTNPPAT
jgi:hypothetical protein